MSEPEIDQFRERAERAIDLPELAELQDRGRRLQRTRTGAAAGLLALVLAAGVGIAAGTGGRDDASPPPAGQPTGTVGPTPTRLGSQDGLHVWPALGEDPLVPGRSRVDLDDHVTVSFVVPGPGWEWFGAGLGLRQSASKPHEDGGAVFFLPDPAARLAPCSAQLNRQLGADPARLIDNVEPLRHLAHARVLEAPSVVEAFGGTTAVHLGLETDGACASRAGANPQLRGVVNHEGYSPSWGGAARLDVWHVLLPTRSPRAVLVAAWHTDSTLRHRQQQALIRSIRLSVP